MTSSLTSPSDAGSRMFGRFSYVQIASLFMVFHAALWILFPLKFLSGLHLDTLEIIAWAQNFALGYPKHPPMATWLFASIEAVTKLKLIHLLILSQICLAATAYYVWKTIRLYASELAALIGVILFLETASATYFSVEFNHNLFPLPFTAAALYFGLGYLEKPNFPHAIMLGISAGLALLTKYQAAFVLLVLMYFAIAIPRYRAVWVNPLSYISVLVCFLVISPHVIWDWHHNWATLQYAAEDRKISEFYDVLRSFNQVIDGVFVAWIGAVVALAIMFQPRALLQKFRASHLPMMIAFGPGIFLILLSIITAQIIRQGWFLPISSTIAVGLALMLPDAQDLRQLVRRRPIRNVAILSLIQVVAFFGLIIGSAYLGLNQKHYHFDSEVLASEVTKFWNENKSGQVSCLAFSTERETLINAAITLDQDISIEALPSDIASVGNLPCRAKGGIAIVSKDSGADAALSKLGLPRREAKIPTAYKKDDLRWSVVFFLL